MQKIVGIDVGIRNLALCCLDARTGTIDHWHVLDVLGDKHKNATKTSIADCVTCMLHALSELDWWSTLGENDVVAIESQPVGRIATGNIKCKCISHAIQSFVVLHTKATPIFVNPKTKFGTETIAEYGGLDLAGDENVKKRYKMHKAAAVKMVDTTVADTPWVEWWTTLKKKDDAADAFLLAKIAMASNTKKRKRKQ